MRTLVHHVTREGGARRSNSCFGFFRERGGETVECDGRATCPRDDPGGILRRTMHSSAEATPIR